MKRGAVTALAPDALLDLEAIEAALRSAQRTLAACRSADGGARDPLDEPVIENMLVAYASLGALLSRRIDPLAMGCVQHLLDLNGLVLCGTDPVRRARHASHFEATERRFYDERDAGIGDLVETMRLDAGKDPWDRAALAYICVLSKPQLFIEGNHRTGALIASCVLLQATQPPFVLSSANADEYFAASSRFRDLRKHSLGALMRMSALRRQFAQFLRTDSHTEYLSHA